MRHLDTVKFSLPRLPSSLSGVACSCIVLGGLVLNFLFTERHDDQRVFELFVLLLGTVVFTLRSCRLDTLAFTGRQAQWAILAFFTLGLLSTVAALSPRHALYEWSSLLLLCMLTACIASEIATAGKDALRPLLYMVGAICAVYTLRVLLFYASTLAIGHQTDLQELALGFSNVRFLNHAQTALLPLLVLLCLQAPRRSVARLGWFVLTAFWWALLYMSESRASLLALGSSCIIVLLVRRAQAGSFLKLMVWSALAGCLLYLFTFVLLPILAGVPPFGSAANALTRTAADPTSGRVFLWARSLELVAQHPWLGVGPLHFAHYGADMDVGAHPHNWVAQIGAEWGVPALLCAMFVAGAGLRALWRAGRHIAVTDTANQHLLNAFLVASVAILIDGLFSGNFVMPQSRLAIALVLGCAIGWMCLVVPRVEQGSGSRAKRTAVAAAVLAAACALVYSVAPDFLAHARSEPLSPAEKASNPGTQWPRLWEAGYF